MPPRRWLVVGLAILPVIFCLESCGLKDRESTETEGSVLQVGDRNYSLNDLERFFQSRLNEFQEIDDADKVKSTLLDSFIEESLLLHKAEELKIEPSPQALQSMRDQITADTADEAPGADAALKQNIAESLMIQQYLRDYLFKNISASREECEAYYKDHLDEFVSNDVVHVREIMVEDETLAKKIQAMLKANHNKNFGELARVYSRSPSASANGDLGTFQRGELPEEFEKVIFRMAPGTISRIVRSQYGYHTFYLQEKVLAHQQKLYEVEGQISKKLLLERQREALQKELAYLADQVPVHLDRTKLDFKYVGTRLAPRGGKPQ